MHCTLLVYIYSYDLKAKKPHWSLSIEISEWTNRSVGGFRVFGFHFSELFFLFLLHLGYFFLVRLQFLLRKLLLLRKWKREREKGRVREARNNE